MPLIMGKITKSISEGAKTSILDLVENIKGMKGYLPNLWDAWYYTLVLNASYSYSLPLSDY